MNERTAPPPNVSLQEAIKLRNDINGHMRQAMESAFIAIERATKSHDIFDKKLSDLLQEKGESSPSSLFIVAHEKRLDPLWPTSPNNDDWKTDFEKFMSASAQQLLEDTGSVQYFIFVGLRYYLERLKDEKFFMLSDLPEMLAVDRRMTILTTWCYATSVQLPKIVSEIKRKHNSKLGKAVKPDASWKLIKRTLEEWDKDTDYKERQWTVFGIANELAKTVLAGTKKDPGPIPNTIATWFTNRLGSQIRGRKKYYLSEVINMINNR